MRACAAGAASAGVEPGRGAVEARAAKKALRLFVVRGKGSGFQHSHSDLPRRGSWYDEALWPRQHISDEKGLGFWERTKCTLWSLGFALTRALKVASAAVGRPCLRLPVPVGRAKRQ